MLKTITVSHIANVSAVNTAHHFSNFLFRNKGWWVIIYVTDSSPIFRTLKYVVKVIFLNHFILQMLPPLGLSYDIFAKKTAATSPLNPAYIYNRIYIIKYIYNIYKPALAQCVHLSTVSITVECQAARLGFVYSVSKNASANQSKHMSQKVRSSGDNICRKNLFRMMTLTTCFKVVKIGAASVM